MSVIVTPAALETAASDLTDLATMLENSNAAVAAPTTTVLPSAADEISVTLAQLFNAHGQAYQQIAVQAQAVQQQFKQTLASAGTAYQQTELAAQQALRDGVGTLEQPLVPLLERSGFLVPPPTSYVAPPVSVNPISLVVGGAQTPVLPQSPVTALQSLYNLPGTVYALYTPEQFWPLTPQVGNLTLGQSIAQGSQLLTQELGAQIAHGNSVTLWTSSESSAVATDAIRNLIAQGSPGSNLVRFVLTGNPNNPNGGLFERFNGMYITGLDVLFNGATPPNAPYAVSIFTNQYDGAANFPQYPLNFVSDANRVAGLFLGQHNYYSQATYVQLPTSPGYTGATQYFMSLTQNLPLLDPLRHYVPQPYGTAIADLLQPDLRVIVDMGYGSGEYANIPTPASLLELPNPFTIVPDLAHGTVQGAQAFGVDLGLLPQSMYPTGYPFSPVLDPNLNFPLPQSTTTGLSLLTVFEGQLLRTLGMVPPWDR